MRILHVEDDIGWFDRSVKDTLVAGGRNHVFHAATRENAQMILESESIDYLIVDLSIPNVAGESAEYEHGVALVHEVKSDFPGMPILILTGQATEEAAEQFEDQVGVFFWDGQIKDLIKTRPKRRLAKALDLVLDASASLEILNRIEVYPMEGCSETLSIIEKRIMRLFCCNVLGDSYAIRYRLLTGGYSDAKVFSVEVLDSSANCLQRAVGKLASSQKVNLEVKNSAFLQMLPVGLAPVLLGEFCAGCGDTKGVFFQLAQKFENSFYHVLRESDDLAAELINRLDVGMSAWSEASTVRDFTVAEIRRSLVSDEKFEIACQLLDREIINKFEENTLKASCCTVHKDLHGENILVSGSNEFVLIDYGDVTQDAPALIDPITLWLSSFFHPAVRQENNYVDATYARKLIDGSFNVFGRDYPVASGALNEWRQARAKFSKDTLAVIYAYSVKQLPYYFEAKDEVNIDLAKSLIAESIRRWDE